MRIWNFGKKKRPDIQAVSDQITEKERDIAQVCKVLRYICKRHGQNIDGYYMALSKKRRLESERFALISLRCNLKGNCIGELFSIPE